LVWFGFRWVVTTGQVKGRPDMKEIKAVREISVIFL